MAAAEKSLPSSRTHLGDSAFTPLALRGKKKQAQKAASRYKRSPEAAQKAAANPKTLVELRSKKRKHSDACIQRHVSILSNLAAVNGGYVPPYKWLDAHGYFTSYDCMKQYPAAFEHLKKEQDKKFEIYEKSNTDESTALVRQQQILAPGNYKQIADYDLPAARFSPTALRISEGISEKDWMEIGRGLSRICMSTFWWIGDFLIYGKDHFGVKIAYDLAQQATAFSRSVLYNCTQVSRRFPPERRREALTFYHHSILKKFLPEVADKVLDEGVIYGYTARQCRDMALELIGEKRLGNEWSKITMALRRVDWEALKTYARTAPDFDKNSPWHSFDRAKILIAKWVEEFVEKLEEKENAAIMAGSQA